MQRPHTVVVLCLLLLSVPARAAEPAKPAPGDAMIDAYLAREAERLSHRFLDGATTRAEWEARRPRLKQEYFEMLGLWPLPEKTPLHPTVTGTVERGDVVIEKVYFQSRPGLYVTGNLYRPKKVTGKLPAVLYVCGHSGRGRDGNKTAFQDHGMWFAHNGYVCLIIDTLQLGEIPGIHHGTYQYGRWWWQARGYTPAGVECWNGVRAIDYLVGRPDVDAERIAVTGISGGGAATFWIAGADERVKCAVPVSGMSDLESYVKNKVINGHCDCMFLINTYGWQWTTIAALVAPRPLLFCNSDHDTIFPMDGNRRIIARLRKLYALYDKPELVDEYISHGGHEDRPDLRVAAFRWINKHIKHDTTPITHAEAPPLPGKELRVFPEDKDVPKDALNGTIDETFVPKAQVKLPEAGQFAAWKAGLLKQLREKSFRTFPDRVPAGKPESAVYDIETHQELRTEEGIRVALVSSVEAIQGPPGTRTLIVLNPGDKYPSGAPDWATSIAADQSLSARLFPRGVASTAWTEKSPPNYVERAHALVGHTVDEGRVRDIIAAVRYLDSRTKGKTRWQLIGRGQAGVLAAYAALFEPSISEVIIVDPPTSHRDGPIFLNVQRVLDVPEALGLLAPRPLTLVNAKDKAFDRTAEIYRLAGAADKLQRK
ncbi:MAG TPA: prolyl oligopeptidase family serine peptidase [Gemmataceae bacterium]|nr:prolyl oligopeptidase family serine peptidase [Gemmataceae bacterium]